jgi:hypothetical protein
MLNVPHQNSFLAILMSQFDENPEKSLPAASPF